MRLAWRAHAAIVSTGTLSSTDNLSGTSTAWDTLNRWMSCSTRPEGCMLSPSRPSDVSIARDRRETANSTSSTSVADASNEGRLYGPTPGLCYRSVRRPARRKPCSFRAD